MSKDLISDLEALERSDDFWTIGRNDVLLNMISKGPVFDVGAGSGVLTRDLVKTGFDVYALDVDKKACELCRRFTTNIINVSFDKLKTGSLPKFGCVVFADVLEHVENDSGFVAKAYSLLEKGGELVVSVPYSNSLWTKNDDERGHKRRYSRHNIIELLEKSGFRVEKLLFWNFLSVFPLLFGKAFLKRIPHEKISSSVFNSMLLFYFKYFENKIPLPIGSNIVCKAVKN